MDGATLEAVRRDLLAWRGGRGLLDPNNADTFHPSTLHFVLAEFVPDPEAHRLAVKAEQGEWTEADAWKVYAMTCEVLAVAGHAAAVESYAARLDAQHVAAQRREAGRKGGKAKGQNVAPAQALVWAFFLRLRIHGEPTPAQVADVMQQAGRGDHITASNVSRELKAARKKLGADGRPAALALRDADLQAIETFTRQKREQQLRSNSLLAESRPMASRSILPSRQFRREMEESQ